MPRTAREQSTYDTALRERPMDAMTLRAGGPDIVVAPPDADIAKLASDEKFMSEPVGIIFFTDNSPGAPRQVELLVNTGGITGPMREDPETGELKPGVARGGTSKTFVFHREKVYTVPRYVVEVAAHAKRADLKEVEMPGSIEKMYVNSYTFFYPFNVVRDNNPAGPAWFEKVKNDPL